MDTIKYNRENTPNASKLMESLRYSGYDNNIAINPGATEICGNGIEEDCSGADLICAPLSLAAYYSFDVDETATGLITDDSGNLNTATC